MKRYLAPLVLCSLVFGPAGLLSAQDPAALEIAKARGAFAAQARAEAEASALEARARGLAEQIVQAREDFLQRGPFGASFRSYWADRLSRLPVGQLERIAAQGAASNLETLVAAESGLVLADGVSPDLGDSGKDLVYTKITPCRVADTRVVSSPLGNSSLRPFHVSGSTASWFTAQGGTACGIPLGATSVAVNLTVVSAFGTGWLRAYPYGGSGNASVINYAAGNTLANGLILPICDPATTTCTYDLTVAADAAGGHLLIDVMGYFQKVNKAQYRTFTVEVIKGSVILLPANPGCGNYMSITVTAPVAGRITVIGRAMFEVNHTAGTAELFQFGVFLTNSDCNMLFYPQTTFKTVQAGQPAGYYYEGDTVQRVFDVAPGTYTYYVNGNKSSISSTGYLIYGAVTATFNPS